jgi:hypothetical protein
MGTTVQVTDQYGGQITAGRNLLTRLIEVQIVLGDGQESMVTLNPKEPEAMKFLREIFQPIHLEILLES